VTEIQLKRILAGITAARDVVEQHRGTPNSLVMTCAKVFATAQLRIADLINQQQHEAAGFQAATVVSQHRPLPVSRTVRWRLPPTAEWSFYSQEKVSFFLGKNATRWLSAKRYL
jgi:hypothetical protein